MSFGRMATLPPELFSLIFEFAVWSDPYFQFKALLARDRRANQHVSADSEYELYDPQIRTVIGLVSKDWKRIRDMSLRLWTRLDIIYSSSPGRSLGSLKWLLGRSGSLPLDIRLSCSASDRCAAEELFERANDPRAIILHIHQVPLPAIPSLTRVLGVMQYSIPRWRSLTFRARTRAEAYAALLQFRQPATLLEQLDVAAPHVGDTISGLVPPRRRHQPNPDSIFPPIVEIISSVEPSPIMPALFGGKTPSLNDVSLYTFAQSIDAPVMRNLKSIRIMNGWATVDTFIDVLRENTITLEELRMATVDFRDAFLSLRSNQPASGDQEATSPRSDRMVLPSLVTLHLDLPRSAMSCLLSRLSLPSLTSLRLRRTEEPYEEEHFFFPNPTIIPDSSITPRTEDILALLGRMYKDTLPPLQDFVFSYGSVLESNAGFREHGTDAALINVLRLIGGSLTTLDVRNYSHCQSSILAGLSDRQNPLCPSLRTLKLTMCEDDGRHSIRRLVEARVSSLPASGSSEGTSATSLCGLDYLYVEARSGRIVCPADDVRWITGHVRCFVLHQHDPKNTRTTHQSITLSFDSDGEVDNDDENNLSEAGRLLE